MSGTERSEGRGQTRGGGGLNGIAPHPPTDSCSQATVHTPRNDRGLPSTYARPTEAGRCLECGQAAVMTEVAVGGWWGWSHHDHEAKS